MEKKNGKPDKGNVDSDSHLKWIQAKQRLIAAAQEEYEIRKSAAKDAREVLDEQIAELLNFIADLNSGQERIAFGTSPGTPAHDNQ